MSRSLMHRFACASFACMTCVLLSSAFLGTAAQAQVFEDDFDDDEIDLAKWRIDPAPFETGSGDFTAVEADGTLTIAGASVNNWWGGLSLAAVPTFSASVDAPLSFEVDRVLHVHAGSSTRTSVWITDAARDNYVLYSFNSNEGGWSYNRRVGLPGDVPTGGGVNIPEFDDRDASFELHRMRMVADGEFVQLFLDDDPGPLVPFPFSEGIVFQIAAYARQGGADSVTGVFDNVEISGGEVECVDLSPPYSQVLPGEDPPILTLQIPDGTTRPATVTVTSSDAAVARLAGSDESGALEVVFAEGDDAFRSLPVEVAGPGTVELSYVSDFEACSGDAAKVYIPAILLEDDFEDGDLGEEWDINDEPFEDGGGAFTFDEVDGGIRLSGMADDPFWPGLEVVTTSSWEATLCEPVTFQIDQSLLSTSFGAFRAGVWVSDEDREEFVFFSFIRGTAGDWVVNSSTFEEWPPNGDGLDLAAYNCCTFDMLDVPRRVELVANGETVSVIMDGVLGGSADFELEEVYFGFSVYALGSGDTVEALFDNARVLGKVGESTGPRLVRGDSDSNGSVQLTDGVRILSFLFQAGDAPTCMDSADADDNGVLQLTDAVRIFGWLFQGGDAFPAPTPTETTYSPGDCGEDLTGDELGCTDPAATCT